MQEVKDLYIDFDGVILDTIPLLYEEVTQAGIDKNDFEQTKCFFEELDYSKFIKDDFILNDSINCIKKLIDSKKFKISILSHIVSIKEGILKVNYLRKYFKDITIILVPKEISKTKMIQTKDAILIDDYAHNLREWESEGGIGIRFSQELESKNFIVINKLDQVLNIDFSSVV